MPVVAATTAIRGLAACSREAHELLVPSGAVWCTRVLGRSSAADAHQDMLSPQVMSMKAWQMLCVNWADELL